MFEIVRKLGIAVHENDESNKIMITAENARKLRTTESILITMENVLVHPEGLYASGPSHCYRHTKILIHYKNIDK